MERARSFGSRPRDDEIDDILERLARLEALYGTGGSSVMSQVITTQSQAVVSVSEDDGGVVYRTGNIKVSKDDGFSLDHDGDGVVIHHTGGIPTGTVVAYGAETPPDGWLLCEGDEVSRVTYADLFAVIGEAFGPGDGSTTFNLPNLIGRWPMGQHTHGSFSSFGWQFSDPYNEHYHHVNLGVTSDYPDSAYLLPNNVLIAGGSVTLVQGEHKHDAVVDGDTYPSGITWPVAVMKYIIKT